MSSVELKNINKMYDKVTVLKDLNLKIEDQEFFVLLGPSGSGKSTTLNTMAGLDVPTSGNILFDSEDVTYFDPNKRGVAMVFQDYALYPHMNVYKNMAFPLKMKRYKNEYIDKKINEVANILGIKELLKRLPRELSGGQAQRVALGRALVRDPKIFLLDEPLSNLDAKIRSQIRNELKLIHSDLKKTFVYVTHDQQEAMYLGDRVGILNEGVIQQIGTPQEVYKHPKNIFVAKFLGEPEINIFELDKNDGGFKIGDAPVDGSNLDALNKLTLGIRPENILLKKRSEKDIPLKIVIRAKEFTGSGFILIASTESGKEIRIISDQANMEIDEPITAYIDYENSILFDEHGDSINK